MSNAVSSASRAMLAIVVVLSIVNAVEQAAIHLSDLEPSERIFGALKVLVAVAGGAALWRLVRTPQRALPWLATWAALVAVLAGMAPVVFGRAPIGTGALSFAGSGLVLAACLIWWRRTAASREAAATTSSPRKE